MYYTLSLYDIPATRTGAGHNINRPTTDVQHHLPLALFLRVGQLQAAAQLADQMFVTVLKWTTTVYSLLKEVNIRGVGGQNRCYLA